MNREEYRAQIRREVDEAQAEQPAATLSAADGERAEVASLLNTAPEESGNAEQLLAILGDPARSAESRRAALQAIQQLSFNAPLFERIRPALIDILRRVIEDPDERLREMAIEVLAQEKDEYVQRRLIDGIERREEPLVTDEKAIQFLGYDVHAQHFPVIRKLARESADAATRREAVKLLSADTESAELLAGIYDNKTEEDDVRRASGSALMSLDPLKFEELAKQVVVDDYDAESVRAASLTALTHFANPTAIANDTDFVDRVASVGAGAPELLGAGAEEGDLAKAVRLFRSKYSGR